MDCEKITGPGYAAAIDMPADGTGAAIVVLPGASGGALSGRFAPLSRAACGQGIAVARIEIWSDASELNALTLQRICGSLDAAVAALEPRFEMLYGVGKSFGGGVLLARNHPSLRKLSLWAPAFGYAERPTLDTLRTAPIGSIAQAMDITLGADALAAVAAPVQIIHGDADATIPLENSKRIAAALPDAMLKVIPGLAHSPKTAEHEQAVNEAAVQFFAST